LDLRRRGEAKKGFVSVGGKGLILGISQLIFGKRDAAILGRAFFQVQFATNWGEGERRRPKKELGKRYEMFNEKLACRFKE